MNKRTLLTVATCCLIFLAHAQISIVKPGRPSQNDQIKVVYDLSAPQAKLKNKEQIYARVTNYLKNGAITKFHTMLYGDNNILSGQFKLPEQTASFKVEFYTLNRDDDNATQNLIVYDDKHQRPVESAYLEAMFNDNPDSVFQKETANYPANYLAYARYINILSMVKDADSAKRQIKELLNMLNSVYSHEQTHTAGILAALCIGHAKTGDLTTGKNYLSSLFNEFPQLQETAFAFSIYNYEYYKSSNKDVEDDVRQKLKEIFIKFPGAPISRDENVFNYLQNDTSISVKVFEQVLLPMYNNNQLSYYALNNLPEVYIKHNVQLDSAQKMLKNSISQFQTGVINHQYRLNNGHYQLYVPFLLMDLAKVNILKKDYQDAIINSSAAINILTGSNTEGNFLPLLLSLRAGVYKQIGNFNLALDDYRKLYNSGNISALDSMRQVFAQCNVKQKTFDEFVTTLKPANGTKTSNNLQFAPDFSATDLKGNVIHLTDFKGKLVVINIWGIGCGPCVAEMPELNKLVKQYSNQPNIVFLGITSDKTDRLIKFLKIRQYDYKVLNNANNIAEKFNTNSLPVHIVIGKQGEILSRSIGARTDITNYLQSIINTNL